MKNHWPWKSNMLPHSWGILFETKRWSLETYKYINKISKDHWLKFLLPTDYLSTQKKKKKESTMGQLFYDFSSTLCLVAKKMWGKKINSSISICSFDLSEATTFLIISFETHSHSIGFHHSLCIQKVKEWSTEARLQMYSFLKLFLTFSINFSKIQTELKAHHLSFVSY